MSQHPTTPLLGAITHHDPSPFAAACRALAVGGIVAALAACAEHASPTAPPSAAATTLAQPAGAAAAAAGLSADAIDRLLPALEKDASAPVGSAIAALDAKLRDAKSPAAARLRAVDVVQNVLAQFTDAARPDAADLDAMRLEVDEIRASLR
jgi:hypothetical protein